MYYINFICLMYSYTLLINYKIELYFVKIYIGNLVSLVNFRKNINN